MYGAGYGTSRESKHSVIDHDRVGATLVAGVVPYGGGDERPHANGRQRGEDDGLGELDPDYYKELPMKPTKNFRLLALLSATATLVGILTAFPSSVFAGTVYVNYTGQGFTYDGTTYIINDERCGLGNQTSANDGATGQFADWNGPGQPYQAGQAYLLWVLTANGASSATLHLPDKTVNMYKVGGTFKYASGWYDPASLFPGNYSSNTPVYAEYTSNKAIKNVQLTVSHGCAGFFGQGQGAWCSPGFWRNTLNFNPNGWSTIGVDPATATFNGNVSPNFYANDLGPDQLLTYVLNNPNDFGGQLGTAGPYGLTAFNAVGAYLTDQIPGYHFDPSLLGNDQACPIDAHGAFKQ